MLGLAASFVAGSLNAAAVHDSPLSGTLASLAASASGTQLGIAQPEKASPTIVSVTAGVVVREREAGGTWRAVSLSALKIGEPIRVTLDASGRAAQVDAEYVVVYTRAVIVKDGFLVGTDGIARKLVAQAAAPAIPLGAYVALKTDPVSSDAFDAEVSTHPFSSAGKQAHSVTVTFEVRVPVNTPPSSTIYLATNAQNWTPNAIRLSPEPGNKWTATVELAAGTVLQYKFTRGSWPTGETDSAGSQIPNRTLEVSAKAGAQHVDDAVVRWADLPS